MLKIDIEKQGCDKKSLKIEIMTSKSYKKMLLYIQIIFSLILTPTGFYVATFIYDQAQPLNLFYSCLCPQGSFAYILHLFLLFTVSFNSMLASLYYSICHAIA